MLLKSYNTNPILS